MNEQLFRKKSIDRVCSPEQLDAYLRVTNPGIWIVLSAIVVLLAGVCVWGVLGHLDTTVPAVAVCENETVTLYVNDKDIADVQPGMTVQIGQVQGSVTAIAQLPTAAKDSLSDYAIHTGALKPEDWVYAVSTDIRVSSGIYSAKIVVQRTAPISFIVN